MHKLFLVLFLAALVILGGCQTIKGMTKGMTEDITNTWNNLRQADSKFQEDWW